MILYNLKERKESQGFLFGRCRDVVQFIPNVLYNFECCVIFKIRGNIEHHELRAFSKNEGSREYEERIATFYSPLKLRGTRTLILISLQHVLFPALFYILLHFVSFQFFFLDNAGKVTHLQRSE